MELQNQDPINANADLRNSISSVFAFYGQPEPRAWIADLSPQIHTEINNAIERSDIAYQRYLINRHFRNALGNATVNKQIDTMNARWCLIENDTTETWLHLFKDCTAKCIIKNGLCGMVATADTMIMV